MQDAELTNGAHQALSRYFRVIAVAAVSLIAANMAWTLLACSELITPTPDTLRFGFAAAGGSLSATAGVRLVRAANNGLVGRLLALSVVLAFGCLLALLAEPWASRAAGFVDFAGTNSPWHPLLYRLQNEGVYSARGRPRAYINPYDGGKTAVAISTIEASRLEAAYRGGDIASYCVVLLTQQAGEAVRVQPPRHLKAFASVVRCSRGANARLS